MRSETYCTYVNDFPEDTLIFFNEIILGGADCMEEGGNDQVARLAADRARAEVVLRCALVIGGAPRSDALQAEDVVALVKHAELPTAFEHFAETNLALFVVSGVVGSCLGGQLVVQVVAESALRAVAAAVGGEVRANALLGLAAGHLVRQEIVDASFVFVFVALVPLVVLFLPVHAHLLCPNGLDNADLARNRVVAEDDPLSELSFRQLVIILEVVRVVVLLRWLVVVSHHHLRLLAAKLTWLELGLLREGATWLGEHSWLLELTEIRLLLAQSRSKLRGQTLNVAEKHLGLGVVGIDHVLNDLRVHAQLLHHFGEDGRVDATIVLRPTTHGHRVEHWRPLTLIACLALVTILRAVVFLVIFVLVLLDWLLLHSLLALFILELLLTIGLHAHHDLLHRQL